MLTDANHNLIHVPKTKLSREAQRHIPILAEGQPFVVRADPRETGFAREHRRTRRAVIVKKRSQHLAGIVFGRATRARLIATLPIHQTAACPCDLDCGLPLEGRDQRSQRVGKENIIGIQSRDVIAACFLQSAIQCDAQSAMGLRNVTHALIANRPDQLAGGISRAVIDDDQFKVGQGLSHHALDRPGKIVRAVIGRKDDRNAWDCAQVRAFLRGRIHIEIVCKLRPRLIFMRKRKAASIRCQPIRRMPYPLTHVQNPPDSRIRVGIDALAWNDRTGYGRYCRELSTALVGIASRYSFTMLMDRDACAPRGVETVRMADPRSLGNSTRTLNGLWRLSWAVSQMPVDMWFFPSPLNFVPIVSRAPVVVTIHDTIPWRYPDLIFDHLGEQLAWRIKLGVAMRQAARIVTVSNHARQSMARRFGLDSETIAVVGEAPAAAFAPRFNPAATSALLKRLQLPLGARLIVYHGGFSPHKNLRTLVGAFSRLHHETAFSDAHLVLVGSAPGTPRMEFQALEARCRQLGRVRFAGALDDDDLALLLSHATLAVLPSLDEGYGLTGLEAAACGAPLIATRFSALPEVLGDGASYFDPHDEDALYSNLIGLLNDAELRASLREHALERVAALSWAAAATRLLEVFDAVAAARRARKPA